MPLAISACRALCAWSPADGRGDRGDADLFACAGCGSQWSPDQAWTPRQADGTVPAAVRRVRDAQALSAGAAAGAGSGGSSPRSGS